MVTSALHTLQPNQVYPTLDTTRGGLSAAEAAARLALYGRNTLREPAAVPAWRKFLGHTLHIMGLLLLAAGGLALLAGRPVLGGVIWGVVLVNAAFSYWQEHRAERAVAALKAVLPRVARVVRAEAEIQIPAAELVPGDVLVLAEGDHVPADARLVEAFGLRVNQATLTGEAMPALRTADASVREGLSDLERPNLLFAGSSIVSGTGRAVVYATGMLTQFGRIASLTQSVPDAPSPLQQRLARLSRRIAGVAFALGALVFAYSVTTGGLPAIEAFVLALGIIVAVIPEGLRPTVTLSLAVAVQRLARRGVLVKTLASLETLGHVSVICTDKSGTLTQNQMTVREVWVAGQRLTVTGAGYEPTGRLEPNPTGSLSADLEQLLTAGHLCNNARLLPPGPGRPLWTCLGDQTEAALRVLAKKGGLDEPGANLPRVHELPFDARRKRMTTIHAPRAARGAASAAPGRIAFVKGAPHEVLRLSNTVLMAGQVQPLTEAVCQEIVAATDAYARQALRVLALARRQLPERLNAREAAGGRLYRPETVEADLTFLGLVAMMDPPRPEVAAAVKTCREAGIRLIMITGDYGLTAESLARRVGLLTGPEARIITGVELDDLDDAALRDLLAGEVIFARMAPEHKLRLVAALQARGDVVAMTGDGVNDAPALRKTDVGIAMGVTGTDVAKEAADVVLIDDNFAAIVDAVAEGRAVYDNLRKFTTYILASNVPEVLPFLITGLFHLPLALTVTQILAIDLVTDLLPALALGTEAPEPNVMRRPPRRPGRPWIDRGLLLRAFAWLGGLETLLCYVGFLAVYALAGYTDWSALPRVDLLPFAERLASEAGRVYVLATTMFHAGVVMAQVGNAFACRSETERLRRLGLFSNRLLLAGLVAEVLLIGLLIYVPPFSLWFEHLPLPPALWGLLALYPLALYSLERIRKHLVRRWAGRPAATA
jgi:magnesium-transporting ATPase (P-type)